VVQNIDFVCLLLFYYKIFVCHLSYIYLNSFLNIQAFLTKMASGQLLPWKKLLFHQPPREVFMRRLTILALAFFLSLTPVLALAQGSAQTEEAASSEPLVEVTYFIYYGNFDCQVIEPKLANFERSLPDYVHFETLPVVVSRGAVGEDEYYTVNQYADLFFVLDHFGQEKLLRKNIFQTVMDTLANTGEFALVDIDYQMNFLKTYNLSVNEYRDAIESDKVDLKIEKALDYIKKFNVNTVPALVINGKTLILYYPDKGAEHFFKEASRAIDAAVKPSKSTPKPKMASRTSPK
jgi:hypothetical protein